MNLESTVIAGHETHTMEGVIIYGKAYAEGETFYEMLYNCWIQVTAYDNAHKAYLSENPSQPFMVHFSSLPESYAKAIEEDLWLYA